MAHETADDMAFRFLVDIHNGDRALITKWRSEAAREWCLTLQLCTSMIAAVALSRLRQAIIDNTKGDLFWIGEILLNELEKETGFKG